MNLDKIINIIRNLNEEPTNSAGSGAIAGLPPDEPPVKKEEEGEKLLWEDMDLGGCGCKI